MARRDTPTINAGSMADIAFLLLIFFLVTTTMDVDAGIARRLPEKQDIVDPPIIKMKNVFEVIVSRTDDLLIENEYRKVEDIKELAIAFIDNGGGAGNPIELLGQTVATECTWCEGERDPTSSDHPNKAIISLKTDRSTSYDMFIQVQNELGAAYTFLRNRLSLKEYGMTFEAMVNQDAKGKANPDQTLKDKIKRIKAMYPEIISEAVTK